MGTTVTGRPSARNTSLNHERMLEFWDSHLRGGHAGTFPYDKPRPAASSGQTGVQSFKIERAVYQALRRFCQKSNTSSYAVLFSIFRATHLRLTRQFDVTFGCLNACKYEEVGKTSNLISAMQPIRVAIEEECLQDLTTLVETTMAECSDSSVPYESIVSKIHHGKAAACPPLVRVIFALHSSRSSITTVQKTSEFDIEFHVYEDGKELGGGIALSEDLYDVETNRTLLSTFQRVLSEALKNPETPITSLPLLTNDDFSNLDDMGLIEMDKSDYPRDSSVVDVFRRRVVSYLDRTAVRDGTSELTYRQLDQQSDILAQWLARRSLAPETLVGVFAHRSCQAIVAFLGIMKANLAYLPLDTRMPIQRMETILSSLDGKRLILVGPDAHIPPLKMDNVEYVDIQAALSDQVPCKDGLNGAGIIQTQPSATSLAYVMFTSGSTGQPKGVMVEHRGIVRTAIDNNLVDLIPPDANMAHINNLAFDATVWEIYTTILNGRTLICIDTPSLLDEKKLTDIFLRENIQTAFFTPALLKQYVYQCPKLMSGLKTVQVGGDRFDHEDLLALTECMTGNVVNAYGPTENTAGSTWCHLSKTEVCVNGVPIGRAVQNSGIYILDSLQRLVPLGVVGEMVVTGDGVARGYTDPQRDKDRFVTITIAGKTMRAYRTGDHGRYRPTDKKLEFWGRIDGQIKIRGQRIEVEEIEHVLRENASVNNATVVPHYGRDQTAQLLAFVTLHEIEYQDHQSLAMDTPTADDSDGHSEIWQNILETDAHDNLKGIQPEKIGRDFSGWISMYDGSQINEGDMNEWLSDTVRTILNGHPPGNVIEIGSGTGMILFNLANAQGLDSYVGLDPFGAVVRFVTHAVKSMESLKDKVKIYKGTAADIGRLNIPHPRNLAIINSVSQYFPSQEYFFNVIEDLLQLEGMQTIFCGDIRSFALYKQFQVTKSTYLLGKSPTKEQVRRYMAEMGDVEQEFLADPSFFTSLIERLPHLVAHVEILPKRMNATNELSCYRYAAVIHAKHGNPNTIRVHDVPGSSWIDFHRSGLDTKGLLEHLQNSTPDSVVAVSNIPYAKTIWERFVLESLEGLDGDSGDENWLLNARERAENCPSLSAIDLEKLAHQAGYQVEISWARQHSQFGSLDAVFHRYEGDSRKLFRFPVDEWPSRLSGLSSEPWKQHRKEKLHKELYESIRAKLPSYMVPQTITFLGKMPVNDNGKIDRKALAQRAKVLPAAGSSRRQPESETERLVQTIWSDILNIDPSMIGLDDSFFHIGGSSIAAMKVVSQARKAGLELAVSDIFSHPKLQDLCQQCRQVKSDEKQIAPFALLGNNCSASKLVEEVSFQHDFDLAAIQDAYPCTPLQEGLISLTSKRHGDYVLQLKIELSPNLCIDTFCNSWEIVADLFPVLRTRIVQHKDMGLLQVVLKESIRWVTTMGLDEYLQTDRKRPMHLGQPLTRYALVKDELNEHRTFVWTAHHALFDGWSVGLIMRAVRETYLGNEIGGGPQFQSFIQQIPNQDNEDMVEYWRKSLADCESIPFPSNGSSITKAPQEDQVIKHVIPKISSSSVGITTSSLIRASWALVAGRMTNSTDVVFGVLQSGRNAAVADIDKLACPTIATVPLRIQYSRDQSIAQYLDSVQRQATEMIPFEQSGIHRIAKLSPATQHACNFQTFLVVQPQEINEGRDVIGKWEYPKQTNWYNTYALMIVIQLGPENIEVTASFDSSIIKPWIVSKLLRQLEYTIDQLSTIDSSKPLSNVEMILPQDLQQLWDWNATVPEPIDGPVHDMVEKFVQSQPNSPALCAWDGDLTYGELGNLSTKLARYLQKLNIPPNSIIPLCFEKSMWVTVSILGVLKAGYGFVLLDPFIPKERLQKIVSQTNSRLVLSSIATRELCTQLCWSVVTICPELFRNAGDGRLEASSMSPESIAYIVFTSGSTGEPKGITITHGNYASGLYHQAKVFEYSSESRVFDFSSHGFDATIMNTFVTLTVGGCLCIPSDDDRKNNLAGSFDVLKANALFITPSLCQFISPEKMPLLTTLIVGGEVCRVKDIMPWLGKVRVLIAYGPSECTPISMLTHNPPSPSEPPRIGKGVGQVTWVVDPDDHNLLVPPGCVGELLLEGPLIGQGYLGQPEKTAAAFIEDPAWLLRGVPSQSGRRGRLYKTSDLVQYNEDGTLSYVGRKDAQVKIRGQRVELEEVEHRVQECMTHVAEAVAEIILPQGEDSTPMLVAFLELPETSSEASGPEPTGAKLVAVSSVVEDHLAKYLPTYMMPKAFLTMSKLPKSASGKMNRKLLREIGSATIAQGLVEGQMVGTPKRQPSNNEEKQLQALWGRVLKIDVTSIGLDDNFFRLGGDSVDAMRIVSDAYQAGIGITVADIFHHPTLHDLAKQGIRILKGKHNFIQPFALLGRGQDISRILQDIASQYRLAAGEIQDLYPCTPLQEGLSSMTMKRAGEYMNQSILKLSANVSLQAFKKAWESVVQKTPILKTRIVHHSQLGLLQVVLDTNINWIHADSLEQYLHADRNITVGLGEPLARYALIEDRNRCLWFVWTIHHALYDGWSMPLIMDAVNKAYRGEPINKGAQIQTFIKHIQDRDDTKAFNYWAGELAAYEDTPFPSLPVSCKQPVVDSVSEHHSTLLHQRASNATTSTLIRAAWAVVASQMCGSKDVVFGATMSGRTIPVPGITTIVAPTITTVPIRIRVSDDQRVSKYLDAVQNQATEMIPFEQMGLHRIAKISQDSQRACAFQTLLVVQPQEQQQHDAEKILGTWQEVNQQQWFDTNALVIEVCPRADGLVFTASFDSAVIESLMVNRLLERLESVAHQLDRSQPHDVVGKITGMASSDLKDIWSWNESLPRPSQQHAHSLIQQQARSRPSAPAVCAWDGDLTYLELITLSSRLAGQLGKLGVGEGMLVPLCFEKSMWTTVAIVAVLQAGAGFVLLEPGLPEQRLQTIVAQCKARIIVSSAKNRALSSRLCQHTILVDSSSVMHLIDDPQNLPTPALSSIAYAIFTSGTTGNPKGVLITHQNISSALHHQIEHYGFDPLSRVYDFSSYSFDPSIFSTLGMLVSGGCLCVPSDQDRQTRLADSISSLRANFLDLTPTIARMLHPSQVPSVHTVILSGEMIQAKDIERWWHKTRVINMYGPSECTITSTINANASSPDEALSIGKGAGLLTWIVDPADHTRLLPPGCIGELVLEGPLVGDGYLDDPEKTAAAFIEPPKWLLEGTPGDSDRHKRRLYKTGDLVQYNSDGGLTIIGRKDTQVKLRGQRVELAEVESAVQDCLPEAMQVIAEIIPPMEDKGSSILVAFVELDNDQANRTGATLLPMAADVENRLTNRLPNYMIPTAIFSIQKIPLTPTGKTDRRKLRQLCTTTQFSLSGKTHTTPENCQKIPTTYREILETEQPAYALAERIYSMCALWVRESLGCDDPDTSTERRRYQDLPLHSCGLDSVSLMSLMYFVSEKFDVKISIRQLMDRKATIKTLAHTISSLQANGANGTSEPASTQESDTVNLMAEILKHDATVADTQASVAKRAVQVASRNSKSRNSKSLVVLLTGSTGFIGTQILRQLLEHGQVRTVIALARGETATSARERVIDAARKALWWTQFHADKLQVWQGDLARPHLGLGPAHHSALSESHLIDVIIHDGAVVHWGSGFRDLEAVNVGATVALLQHAVARPDTGFIYVTGGRQWAPENESEELVAEELSSGHTNGYSQTKFVAEAVVRRAALRDKARPGHVGIVSPGLVIGTSTEGVANSDDYIWRLALACIRLGAYNADMADEWLPVSDAATMAADIVNAALQPSATVTCATDGMLWRNFWDILGYVGYTLEPKTGSEWLADTRADIEAQRESHPLWPLAHMIESQNTRQDAQNGHHQPISGNTSVKLQVAVVRNIEFLARVGFLPQPPLKKLVDSPNLDQHRGSFSRTSISV